MGSSSSPHGTTTGTPPPQSSTPFGDFVQRFAWACLLRPAGVKMALKDDDENGEISSDSEDWHNNSSNQTNNNNTNSNNNNNNTINSNNNGKLSYKSKSKSSSFKEAKEEDNDDFFHEADWESEKISSETGSRIQALETTIAEIFNTVSALKSAYIQLQAAHSPFDPEKLRVADKAVILELRKLSEMKHSFRDQQRIASYAHNNNHHGGGGVLHLQQTKGGLEEQNEELRRKVQELQTATNIKQRAVETYEMRVRACEQEIEQRRLENDELNQSLQRIAARREKLEKRLRKLESQRSHHQSQHHLHHQQSTNSSVLENGRLLFNSPLDSSAPNAQIFEVAVQNAREAALGFSKLLVSLMRGVQWDLEAAAESIEQGICYARPAHRRYAFESYVCHRMFCGFENENFYINGSLSSILDPVKHRAECFHQFRDMRGVDPSDLVGITPDCLFGKFCHRKYLQIVHEKMEESFFGGFDQHRELILAGGHPRTRFYQSFLRFAKAVWLVHRLAFSFDPTASIFQVKRRTEFDPAFMESAARNVRMNDDDDGVRPRVGFTVMPGFRVDKWIVKCQVYLDGMVASED